MKISHLLLALSLAVPFAPLPQITVEAATIERPEFPSSLGELNKKAIGAVTLRTPELSPELILGEATQGRVTIAGEAEATQEEMIAYIKSRNPSPKLTCTVEALVSYYYDEAGAEGVRPDVALAQACKETGFFAYGGDVLPKQNNYCGLGATGNKAKGATFKTARLGVRAHIQHLLAYSRKERPKSAIVDPRYELVVANPNIYGKLTAWTDLNGVWAVPGTHYGEELLALWEKAKSPQGTKASLDSAELRIEENPTDASAYLRRGIVYEKMGENGKAAADFEEALKLDKKNSAARYNLAILTARTGDEKKALKSLDSLLKDEPDLCEARLARGTLLLRKGDGKKAKDDFTAALKKEKSADIYNALAVANVYSKDYEKGWSLLKEAAALYPDDENILINQCIMQACVK